jgi:hypothetical protein
MDQMGKIEEQNKVLLADKEVCPLCKVKKNIPEWIYINMIKAIKQFCNDFSIVDSRLQRSSFF